MLIKCPECGKEISPYAKYCPNCGAPNVEYLVKRRVYREKALNNELVQVSGMGEHLLTIFAPFATLVGVVGLSMILSKLFGDTWFNIMWLQICCLFFFWPTWFQFHGIMTFFEVLWVELVFMILGGLFGLIPDSMIGFLFVVMPIVVVVGEFCYGIFAFCTRPEKGKKIEPMTTEDVLIQEMEDL